MVMMAVVMAMMTKWKNVILVGTKGDRKRARFIQEREHNVWSATDLDSEESERDVSSATDVDSEESERDASSAPCDVQRVCQANYFGSWSLK